MRLPNFTAEFSLYQSREPYRVSQTMTRSQESIHPAQFGEIPIPDGPIPGDPSDGPIIIPPICFPFCQQFCFGFPPRCFTLCRRICI